MRQSNKWLALIATSVGTVMSTLNASIVNIANPVLAADFAVTMAQVQWVTTVYLIVASSLMLFFGRLGERVGSHQVYIVGIATFTLGCLACFFSDNLVMLMLARILQGLGASMTIAVGMGLVATIFPQRQRGRAIGVNVLMVGIGNVAGPAVGGFILAYASWHYVFLLSVPFGVIAFIMAALWLRSPLPKHPETSLDMGGSLLFASVIACLIVFLSGGFAGQEWFGLLFIILLVVFIVVERKAKSPLLEPTLLRNKRFMLGNLIAFFSYSAHMMLQFQLPFFLETVWAIPVGTVGLLMMVSALFLAVSGPASGFFSDRFGALKVMPLAIVMVIACMVCSFLLDEEEAIWLFVIIMVLAGMGIGFLNTPNNSEIMTAAGREHASFASGFVGTNRNLGFCIGTALSASVFSLGTILSPQLPGLPYAATGVEELEYIFAFRTVLLVCLLLVIVSFVLCLYLKYSRNGTHNKPHQQHYEREETRKESKNVTTKDFRGTGVCSSEVSYTIDEDGVLHDVAFSGGCQGNLRAVALLVEGRPAHEVISTLDGLTCGRKGTSCSDQFARALKEEQ